MRECQSMAIRIIAGGLEVVGVLKSEVFEGCLLVIWGGSYKVSLGTKDGFGGGPFEAQVRNRVIDCKSKSIQ